MALSMPTTRSSEVCTYLSAHPKLLHALTGLLLILVLLSPTPHGAITRSNNGISISLSPSVVGGSPGSVFNITMYYEVSNETELRLDLPEINDGGVRVFPVSVYGMPDYIEGSGSVDIRIETSDQYSGVFYVHVEAKVGNEWVTAASLKLDLTEKPSGIISYVEVDSGTLKEAKWFKYSYQSSTGYYVLLDQKNITIYIEMLNPGAQHAIFTYPDILGNIYIKLEEDHIIHRMNHDEIVFKPGEDAIVIKGEIGLRDYAAPGTYDLIFSLTKRMKLCTYNDATGVYDVYKVVTYNLSNITYSLTVKEVEPPPFLRKADAYVKDLDFSFYSNDNLYFHEVLKATLDVDVEESCLSCYDPVHFYPTMQWVRTEIYLGMGILDSNGETWYGIGSRVSTMEVDESDEYVGWVYVSQDIDRQDEFPYMYIRRTSGRARMNVSAEIPLTIWNLMFLSRLSGLKMELAIFNYNPTAWSYNETLVREEYEVYPYVFEPPFYAILYSDVNVTDLNYTLAIAPVDNGYVISVPLHFMAHVDVERIIGDEEFEECFGRYGLPDTSNDTAVLIVTVKLLSDHSEYELGQKAFPIYLLEQNPYGFNANVTGVDTGTIPFTMKGIEGPNGGIIGYEPYEAVTRRTIGDIAFDNLDFSIMMDPWLIRTAKWLEINVTLLDKVFNKVVASYGERYNISDLIRGYFNTTNSCPSASIEYEPSIVSVGEDVVFRSTSEDPDGRIVETHWQIIDENGSIVYESYETMFTYSFEAPGTYLVVLSVKDDGGAVANTTTVLHVLGDFVIMEETGVDIGGVPPANTVAPGSVVIEVEHVSTGLKKTISGKNPFTIGDIIFMQPNTPYQGLFELTIRIGASSNYPETHIWLEVTILDTGEVYVNVVETWNTWLMDSDGVWRPVVRGGDLINVNDGAVFRVRNYELWEEIYVSFLRQFLEEAGIPKSDIVWLLAGSRIEHERGAHPHYEYWSGTLVLPSEEEMYCLSYLRSSQVSGWYNLVLKTGVRCDESLEDFYHEFGHAIKYNFYSQQGLMRKILDYLGTGGQHSVDEPFPAYLGIKYLSSVGAFDEGHSEFFATLLVEYIRGTAYYNTTLPVYGRARFYDEYDAQHVFSKPGGTSFYGTKYEGYTVEGRVAGSLLAVLYGSPDPSQGSDYESRPADAVRAYSAFLDGVGFCRKYLQRVPINVREALYGILAAHPELTDKVIHYASPSMYNLMLTLNTYNGPTGSVWGSLVVVVPRSSGTIYASYQDSGSLITVSVGDAVMFQATPLSKISPAPYIGSAAFRFIIVDPATGKPVALVDARGSAGSYIQFHRGGIRLVGDIEAYIDFMSGTTVTVYGNNFVVIPHSTVLVSQDEGGASVTVIDGEVEVEAGNGGKEFVTAGEVAVLDASGAVVRVESIDTTSISEWRSEPIIMNASEASASEVVGEEPLASIYNNIVSQVSLEPPSNVVGGSTLDIVVHLNESLVKRMGYEGLITIIVRDKDGRVLLNETHETRGHYSVKSSLPIPIMYFGELRIEVLADNWRVYEGSVGVGISYYLVAVPVAAAVAIAAALVIRRRRSA